ncbi:uncharacterized protein [Periplaneta americana]|uniref:uncharacterized protein n=1 Tax=Periplaneta americana TaxID=6978 RepID=UPI0037E8DE15
MAANLTQVEDSMLNYEREIGDRGSSPDSVAFSASVTCTDHVDWSVTSQGDYAPAGVAHILNHGNVAETIQTMIEEQAARIVKGVEKRVQAALRHMADRQPEAGGASKAMGSKNKMSSGEHRNGAGGRCCSEGTSCGSVASSSRASSRPMVRAGGELVDAFDPDDRDCNVDRWLNKIDQLGSIHDWREYERLWIMQAKLRGAAKVWFNRLEGYDLSWSEWKNALRRAFPWQHDFGESLEELVARRKLPDESMTKYYYAKLALCERCKITGENAISCIIRGLPYELQANALAFKCKTPWELYSVFLSTLDRYQESGRPQGDSKRRCLEIGAGHMAKRVCSHGRAETDRKTQKVRCFNCQELGTHLSKSCPKPKGLYCMQCGQSGHTRFVCLKHPTEEAGGKASDQ